VYECANLYVPTERLTKAKFIEQKRGAEEASDKAAKTQRGAQMTNDQQ